MEKVLVVVEVEEMAPSEVASFGSGAEGGTGMNYIEHHVSKLDTLAGVAIKYGVEVADIKRMNGLVTDLQMFALKTLRIPLPGRHLPSSNQTNRLSNVGDEGTKITPPRICQSKMSMEPPQPSVPQVVDIQQKHCSLRSSIIRSNVEETEMTVYRNASSDHCKSKHLPKSSTIFEKFPKNYNKSRNVPNAFLDQNNLVPEYVSLGDVVDGEAEKSDEKSVRRRQKADAGSGNGLHERLLKEDSSDGTSWFSSSAGKGVTVRQKPVSRSLLHTESDAGWLDSIAVGLGDAIFTDAWRAIHKSPSVSCLKEDEKNNSAIVWPPTNWSLMTDLQALSASAITKPIFGGITIPIAGCKIKAAID